MDIHGFRVFRTVAVEGSVTKVATLLNDVQSNATGWGSQIITDDQQAVEVLRDAQETVQMVSAHWAQMSSKLRAEIQFEESEAE
jgi:hypothetical protein